MTSADQPTFPIAGALAVVTGAAAGIGRATAKALARHGATVVAVDVDGAGAELTAAAAGGEAYQVDVADRAAMLALATRVEAAHGVPDILVNNAGVGMSGRFLDTTLDDWDWILGINLLGVVHGCHAFGPSMVARGSGRVVNVASGLGYTPRATEPAYCTSKAAVLMLSQCLRADWQPRGVGVSVVCPGIINTTIVSTGRYRGERAHPDTVAAAERLFGRRGHAPGKVADAIVDAVRYDRFVVPVGPEARLGWAVNGLVPGRLVAKLARTPVQGV